MHLTNFSKQKIGRYLRLGMPLVGLMLSTGCVAQLPPAAPAAPASTLQADLRAEAALLARIHAEIGDARCTSDAQCRTLPIGEKACGGPEYWLAWSTSTGRASQLQRWAEELAALQRQRNERRGIQSTCQYNADPGAMCQAQRCVPQAQGSAR